MTGEPDPQLAKPSADEPRGDVPAGSDSATWGYDDFLAEVNRLAASRQAASRHERDVRTLSLATLGVALGALGIALVALAVAIVKA